MDKTYVKKHLFVGEADTKATDGFAGFQLNQPYTLRYTRKDGGAVVIELDHMPYGRQMVVTAAEFEKWFKRA